MLELKRIRQDVEAVKAGLLVRNFSDDALKIVDEITKADDIRKSSQQELDALNANRNKLSAEIGNLYKQGKREEAEKIKAEAEANNVKVKEIEQVQRDILEKLDDLLLQVPNIPHPSVKAGTTEEDNEIVKECTDAMPDLPADALPHWELATKHNLIDWELGAKITGSGFVLYTGQGARLERALINFFLNEAAAAGYLEVIPPLLVNEDSARATGQLPDKEGQMYHATEDDLYLIPTAEVPITNMYRGDILQESDLPVKLTGYTPCFRREAGSYGAHVKGLNRLHQFDKVEIVQMVDPDKSYEVLDEMVAHVEGLLVKLGLPYRILRLCGGDIGFTAALTFDFEVFSAAQKKWLEVSSVSNFETYQASRLKLRVKKEKGNVLAHTLNGSALALARIVASILENFQTENGIIVPEVLRPFMGIDVIK